MVSKLNPNSWRRLCLLCYSQGLAIRMFSHSLSTCWAVRGATKRKPWICSSDNLSFMGEGGWWLAIPETLDALAAPSTSLPPKLSLLSWSWEQTAHIYWAPAMCIWQVTKSFMSMISRGSYHYALTRQGECTDKEIEGQKLTICLCSTRGYLSAPKHEGNLSVTPLWDVPSFLGSPLQHLIFTGSSTTPPLYLLATLWPRPVTHLERAPCLPREASCLSPCYLHYTSPAYYTPDTLAAHQTGQATSCMMATQRYSSSIIQPAAFHSSFICSLSISWIGKTWSSALLCS